MNKATKKRPRWPPFKGRMIYEKVYRSCDDVILLPLSDM